VSGIPQVEETELGKNAERVDIFERELDRNAANFVPLSPLSFLKRAADIYPDKIAVIHGDRRHTYREFYGRCRRLASALAQRGVGIGDTVG
jgi:fatty-acyl-CoA synthase